MKQFNSPVGELEWIFHTGDGKTGLQGQMQYVGNVVMSEEQAEAVKAEIAEFWEANKPKGAKAPKSIGLYPHKVKNEEKSTPDENVYDETGKWTMSFKTGTEYQDGSPKAITIFNSKGNEVQLGNKKIGNGSRGRLTGMMAIYDQGVAARGITFYLNGIQLSKFVEFTGAGAPDELEDEDGDGFEDLDFEGVSDEEKSTPRL